MRHINSHKSDNLVKENFLKGYSEEVIYRYNKIESWDNLKAKKCEDSVIEHAIGVSKSTIFRWKKLYKEEGLFGLESVSRRPHNFRQAKEQARIRPYVLALRKKYPLFGKGKIKVMLEQEYGICTSESSVGLVISKLIKEGKVQHVHAVCGKRVPNKWRKFDDHAKRYSHDLKAQDIGEMVQIDHMTEGEFKHFAAICPISKFTYVQAYTRATALNAKKFLQEVVLVFPFEIQSIQVDGGSEFMAEFEQECKKYGIPLYVLPPRSPKINGCVERSNGTFHYEFYAQYPRFKDLKHLNQELTKFCRFYNEKRPHQRLHYLTPMRYLKYRKVQAA